MQGEFSRPLHVHIFGHDLRLPTNPGLGEALAYHSCTQISIIPIFIMKQDIFDTRNILFSSRRARFVIQCLDDLSDRIRAQDGELYIFNGHTSDVVCNICTVLQPDSIGWSGDSVEQRSKKCLQSRLNDTVLIEGSKTRTLTTKVQWAKNSNLKRLHTFVDQKIWCTKFSDSWHSPLVGGRSSGLLLLKSLSKNEHRCNTKFASFDNRALFLPYATWGCLSSQELRDRNQDICPNNHEISDLKFEGKFDIEALVRWCKGETGIPFVDAGMRELFYTGILHDQILEAIVTCGHYLAIPMQLGVRWIHNQVITGSIRTYVDTWELVSQKKTQSPWTTGLRIDPDTDYIKQWIPELRSLLPKIIHGLHDPLIYHDAKARYGFEYALFLSPV